MTGTDNTAELARISDLLPPRERTKLRTALETLILEAQQQELRSLALVLVGAEPQHLGEFDLDPLDYSTTAEYALDVAGHYVARRADEKATTMAPARRRKLTASLLP